MYGCPVWISFSFLREGEGFNYPQTSLELTHSMMEDDLELLILFPLPPECLVYRYRRTHHVYDYSVLGSKPKAVCLISKHSTNCATFPVYIIPRPDLNYEFKNPSRRPEAK